MFLMILDPLLEWERNIKVARGALAAFANAAPKDRRLPAELLATYEALNALEVAMIEGFRETNEEVS